MSAAAPWIDTSRRLRRNWPRCPWIDCWAVCTRCGHDRSYGSLMPPPRVGEEGRVCAGCGVGEVPDHEWPRETLCRVCRGVEQPPQRAAWRARPYTELDATNDKWLMTLVDPEAAQAEVDRRLRRDRRQGSLL